MNENLLLLLYQTECKPGLTSSFTAGRRIKKTEAASHPQLITPPALTLLSL
jgi:hypothetical protein